VLPVTGAGDVGDGRARGLEDDGGGGAPPARVSAIKP
jgi:hypothetical protein